LKIENDCSNELHAAIRYDSEKALDKTIKIFTHPALDPGFKNQVLKISHYIFIQLFDDRFIFLITNL